VLRLASECAVADHLDGAFFALAVDWFYAKSLAYLTSLSEAIDKPNGLAGD